MLISTGFKSGGFNALGGGPLSGREFENETAISYEGGFKSSWFDNRSYDIANLRIGLRAERFDIEAFVENVFDETYATGATAGSRFVPIFGVSEPLEVGPTRRFGARARIRF